VGQRSEMTPEPVASATGERGFELNEGALGLLALDAGETAPAGAALFASHPSINLTLVDALRNERDEPRGSCEVSLIRSSITGECRGVEARRQDFDVANDDWRPIHR
jgi:hypothetical protein